MVFPTKSDYPNNFAILENQRATDMRLYASLIQASASAYFESDPFSRFFLKRKFYLVGSLLSGRQFERVLDAGCGIGFFMPYLSTIAGEVVGVERTEATVYAREMLKKRAVTNASVDQHDLLSLPYKDSSFDLIVCLSTLDGLARHELKIVLSTFRRILKPNGVLVIGYSTENSLIRFLHNKLSFLFGKRLRTKQLLDTRALSEAVFARPRSAPETVEQIAREEFSFRQRRECIFALTPLLKLYRTVLMENKKS